MTVTNLILADGYKPHKRQYEVHRCGARWVVVSAGVRGGKSKCGAAEFVFRVFRDLADVQAGRKQRKGERSLYWIIGPTFKLTEYAWQYVKSYIPHQLVEKVISNQQSRELYLRGGIKIECHGANNPERLVGASVAGMLIDEAARVKGQTWQGSLRGRLVDTEGFAVMTTSPMGGRNCWVYKDFISKSGLPGNESIKAISWTTEENTHIPRAEIEAAKNEYSAEWYAREFLASWDSFGGAIYPEFNDDLHITTESKFRLEHRYGNAPWSKIFTKVISAIDFGFHSGCMLTIGEIGDNNWAVIDEVYGPGYLPVTGSNKTWLTECRRVQREYGVRQFYGDSAEPDSIQALSVNGISIMGCTKDTLAGIRRVTSAMHPRKNQAGETVVGLHVFDRCKNLIRELRNYQWKPNREQTAFLDEPADGQDDHACDALRYAAMELRYYDYLERVRRPTHSVGPVC